MSSKNIEITLSDDQYQRLKYLSEDYNVPVEVLLQTSLQDWLCREQDNFETIKRQILNDNIDLYRRLA